MVGQVLESLKGAYVLSLHCRRNRFQKAFEPIEQQEQAEEKGEGGGGRGKDEGNILSLLVLAAVDAPLAG